MNKRIDEAKRDCRRIDEVEKRLLKAGRDNIVVSHGHLWTRSILLRSLAPKFYIVQIWAMLIERQIQKDDSASDGGLQI